MTDNTSDQTGDCPCSWKEQCTIEAILTLDERGQIVIPKDIRESSGMKPGEKLALVSWKSDGEVCCLVLMRTGHLSGMVKDALSPLAASIMRRD